MASQDCTTDKRALYQAAAIQGLAANPEFPAHLIAEKAEQIADAMLRRERESSKGRPANISDIL